MVMNSAPPIIRAALARGYDGVVSVDERADYNTLQAADDDLDAGNYSLYVKEGTYSAGLTVSTDKVYIYVEPGTVIQAAIILSGDNVTLVLGAGCDVQGLITLSGVNCSLICQNGVDIEGINASGNKCLVDGGGWDTIVDGGIANHAIIVSGDDVIIRHISAKTTGGGGQVYDVLPLSGARITLGTVQVVDGDDRGITTTGAATDAFISGCTILSTDGHGILINGARSRVIGNYVLGAGDAGITVSSSGDNSVIVGNVVQDQTSESVEITTDAEDCVVVANRLDGAITDNSGTSTVASNDVTAF